MSFGTLACSLKKTVLGGAIPPDAGLGMFQYSTQSAKADAITQIGT